MSVNAETQELADYAMAARIMIRVMDLGPVELQTIAAYALDGVDEEGVRFIAGKVGVVKGNLRSGIGCAIKGSAKKTARVVLGAILLEGYRFCPGNFAGLLRKHGIDRHQIEADILADILKEKETKCL